MSSSARDCFVTNMKEHRMVGFVVGLCDVMISDYSIMNWKRYGMKVHELTSGTSLLYAIKD
jgi:hypothetical protein